MRLGVNTLRVAVFAAAVSVLLSPVPAAGYFHVYLAVPRVQQTQSNWCWAASNQAVLQYMFSDTFSQCAQANAAFGRTDCCSNPSSSNCNRTNNLGSVQSYDYARGYGSTYSYRALTWSETANEVTHYRPFIARKGWAAGGGHFVVVRGADTGAPPPGPPPFISVMDPIDATYRDYDFAYFTNNSSWTWTHTLWSFYRR